MAITLFVYFAPSHFLYIWVFCLHICLCTTQHTYMSGAYRGQTWPPDPLELQLQIIVRHHVDGGDQTWVLSLAEQPVLLTTGPLLQPSHLFFKVSPICSFLSFKFPRNYFLYLLIYVYVCMIVSLCIYMCDCTLSAVLLENRGECWALELVVVRCWELNLRPLQEQYILLTTEPSLQPLRVFVLVWFCFPS